MNNPIDFVEADYDAYELFISADVNENTSFVIEDSFRYEHSQVVIVLHSVINDYFKNIISSTQILTQIIISISIK